MKLFALLFGSKKKNRSAYAKASADKGKTLDEYQREMLVNQGKQQFEKLKDLGLNIPVRLT